MADYTQRRRVMVDTQVRPSDVTEFPIIDAMLNIPRELFVPQALREAAYSGEHLPLGPHRVVKDAPLEWARKTGLPIYSYAFATSRGRALNTWDKMWLPVPWTSGVLTCREWTATIPRAVDADTLEGHRLDLQAALDAVTDESDRAVGREPDTRPE